MLFLQLRKQLQKSLIYFDSPIRRLWVAYYKYSQPLNWDYQGAGFAPWDVFTVHQFTGSDMDRNMVNTTKEGWLKMANPNDVGVNLRYGAILLPLCQQTLLLSMMPLVVTLDMYGFVNHEKKVMVTWLFVMLRLTNLLENLNKQKISPSGSCKFQNAITTRAFFLLYNKTAIVNELPPLK